MDAERELVDVCALSAEIENADLRVRYTTVESGLWVRLQICQFTLADAYLTAEKIEGTLKMTPTKVVIAQRLPSSPQRQKNL